MAAGRSLVLLLCLGVSACALGVQAHEDVEGDDGRHTLRPGEPLVWVREIHYHRVVAQIDAVEAEGAHLLLSVVGPDGNETLLAGPGSSFRVNTLIPCCDNATWTPHTLRLETFGTGPVEVDVELRLLHDNVAIAAYDAEPGAGWQTTLIISLIVGMGVIRAHTGVAVDVARARDAERRGLRVLAGAWGAALLLVVVGWVRFGGPPLAASLAATEPIPQFGGPFLNPHAVLMLGLMVLWGVALWQWGTLRRHRPRDAPAWERLGLLLLLGIVVVVAATLAQFGWVWWPTVIGGVPALLLVAAMMWRPSASAT